VYCNRIFIGGNLYKLITMYLIGRSGTEAVLRI
jgi:hypothetical protein